MNERKFVIVTWPDSQELMDYEGFEDNCCLINEDPFLADYGSSAYFVDEEWLNDSNKVYIEE